MGNSEDYQAKLPEIMAIDDTDITIDLHMPISVFLQEADNLFLWCVPDKEKLMRAGLDWQLAADIPVRAGSVREAEARFNALKSAGRESAKVCKVKMAEAAALRNRLLHDFRFAYRNIPELIRTIRAIVNSNSQPGIIQDLNDLSVMGKNNPQPLEAVNFDFPLLDKAAALSNETGWLLADVKVNDESKTVKRIRDKAITLLKRAVDDVRRYGQFVFWRDHERKQGYTSAYLRKKKKSRIKTDANTQDVSPDTN